MYYLFFDGQNDLFCSCAIFICFHCQNWGCVHSKCIFCGQNVRDVLFLLILLLFAMQIGAPLFPVSMKIKDVYPIHVKSNI